MEEDDEFLKCEAYWAGMLLMLWMIFGSKGFIIVIVFDLFRKTSYAGLEWTVLIALCYIVCIFSAYDYPMECLLMCWAIFVACFLFFFISVMRLKKKEEDEEDPSLEKPLLKGGIQQV